MKNQLILGKYSIGVGDRFAHQAQPQLRACMYALEHGVELTPVWNKSNREHLIVGSEPASVRAAAEVAVKKLGWTRPFHVDADHISLKTVGGFIPHSDFFTLDVADFIGAPAAPEFLEFFVAAHPELIGQISIPGIEVPFQATEASIRQVAGKFLLAIQEAGLLCRRIVDVRGGNDFITEISMDETDKPQTPAELLVILAACADQGIPIQTIAPKFTGRFNKGVDYVGDVLQFEREFNDNLCVIAHAVRTYELPKSLKLSVHSGSDKFSIYPAVRRALRRHDAGVHLKTAGTTWLEEIIGLAESDGEGLALAKDLYIQALNHRDELCAPYATVIDIDSAKLPTAGTVANWSANEFTAALRHDPTNPSYNLHLRQLLHVGYKIAAKMGSRYLQLLEACEPVVSRNVTENLIERHIQPIFLDK